MMVGDGAYGEWRLWAAREVSRDPRIVETAVQAAIADLQRGGGSESAAAAARQAAQSSQQPYASPPYQMPVGGMPIANSSGMTAIAPKNPAVSLIVSIFIPGVGS